VYHLEGTMLEACSCGVLCPCSWSGAQLLLIGAMLVAVLTATVLVTLFVGHGPAPSSQAADLMDTSGVPALNLQAFLYNPNSATQPRTAELFWCVASPCSA
jgi:hypothetical protein